MAGPISMNFGLPVLRTLNVGTNSLVNELIGEGKMVYYALLHSEYHNTHNSWYSGMEAPIYSIVGILTLYSKNVLGL